MDKIEAVQRMQDHIQEHRNEKITLKDLSDAAMYSPFYCARVFKELTGQTPHEYIRRLRLSESALMLRDEKCKVIDAAYACGFESVDGYQRAFLDTFGCNPRAYAQNPVPLSLFVPYGVKYRSRKERETMEKRTAPVFVEVVERPRRKLILKRAENATEYMSYCEEAGCDVWGILLSMKSMFHEPVCMWLSDKYRTPGTSVYVQGVEVPVDASVVLPEGFEEIILEPAEYLSFRGQPFEEENFEEAIEDVQNAMRAYDCSFLGYEWNDEEPRIQLEPIGTRGYIELRAVKKKA